MDIISILLTALALSADAMSVSVTNGIAVKRLKIGKVMLMAFLFGAFQFFMPVIGWLLGQSVSRYIEAYDHWIAFALLAFIGIKMMIESSKKDDEVKADSFAFGTLIVMAVATSIDALAVGISFASISMDTGNFWLAVSLIGVITFVLSLAGALLGKKLGDLFKKRAELVAGAVLVLIGVKIILEHLGVISF